jgi:hypothetical protein
MRGQQLGPDPNMPPEELLSFNLNNNNNNQYLNEFGKPRSHTKGEIVFVYSKISGSQPGCRQFMNFMPVLVV